MKIDWDLVRETVIQVARENPDYVYRFEESCSYNGGTTPEPGNPPGCIFGVAFSRMGILEDVLKEYSSNAPLFFMGAPADLHLVQAAQDSRKPWGAAISHLE